MTDNKLNDRLKFHWFTWILLPILAGGMLGVAIWSYTQLLDVKAALDKADTAPRERGAIIEGKWPTVPESPKQVIPQETFTALATGYVQGFEHNRAQDLKVQKMTFTEQTDPSRPYIVVKYRRVSVAHPEGENVTGFVVWGTETDGTLTVKHYACTPCGA